MSVCVCLCLCVTGSLHWQKQSNNSTRAGAESCPNFLLLHATSQLEEDPQPPLCCTAVATCTCMQMHAHAHTCSLSAHTHTLSRVQKCTSIVRNTHIVWCLCTPKIFIKYAVCIKTHMHTPISPLCSYVLYAEECLQTEWHSALTLPPPILASFLLHRLPPLPLPLLFFSPQPTLLRSKLLYRRVENKAMSAFKAQLSKTTAPPPPLSFTHTLSLSFAPQHILSLCPGPFKRGYTPSICHNWKLVMVPCAFVCVCDPHLSAQLTVEPLNDCHYLSYDSPTAQRVATEKQRQKVKREEDWERERDALQQCSVHHREFPLLDWDIYTQALSLPAACLWGC